MSKGTHADQRPCLTLSAQAVGVMAAHAASSYPEECCGLLVCAADAPLVVLESHTADNVQNYYHEQNPQMHPRDARTAFLLDPFDLARVERGALGRDLRLAGVFHSHVEVGAYWSDEDRRAALQGGDAPFWPDAVHVVLDAHCGEDGEVSLRTTRAFRWDEASRGFAELNVEVTP